MAKSSKLSKMAANRLAVTATVSSSAQVHGAELAAGLHAILFPAGPQKPDITHKFLSALGGLLDRAAAEVEAADLAHAAELLDDEEPRQRRDAAQAELTALLIGQRGALEALYGPSVSRLYGHGGALPGTMPQLLLHARSIVEQYRKQPLSAKPIRRGVTVKLSDLADELQAAADLLGTALSDVQRETREAQLTLERKTQSAAAWEATYNGVTTAFYGLYLLAGRRDLAERIEPTARRRAGLPEVADQPPAAPPAELTALPEAPAHPLSP